MHTILVTSGAGLVGGRLVRRWLREESDQLISLDRLTYAGNLDLLAGVLHNPRHIFVEGDIGDRDHASRLLAESMR